MKTKAPPAPPMSADERMRNHIDVAFIDSVSRSMVTNCGHILALEILVSVLLRELGANAQTIRAKAHVELGQANAPNLGEAARAAIDGMLARAAGGKTQ